MIIVAAGDSAQPSRTQWRMEKRILFRLSVKGSHVEISSICSACLQFNDAYVSNMLGIACDASHPLEGHVAAVEAPYTLHEALETSQHCNDCHCF